MKKYLIFVVAMLFVGCGSSDVQEIQTVLDEVSSEPVSIQKTEVLVENQTKENIAYTHFSVRGAMDGTFHK
jgi:hypothetical protein